MDSKSKENDDQETGRIVLLRILAAFMLIVTAIVGSYELNFTLTSAENETINREFASYSMQLEKSVLNNLLSFKSSGYALSSIYQEFCPTDDHWPHCYLDLQFLTDSSLFVFPGAMGIVFGVFITPEQKEEVQEYFYSKYADIVDVGNSSCGRGIFSLSENASGSDFRVLSGNGSFGVRRLAPILQTTSFDKYARFFSLFDEYSELVRFQTLNEMFELAPTMPYVSVLSDIITFPDVIINPDPSKVMLPRSIIFTSVRPKYSNSSEPKGYILKPVEWVDILSGIVPVGIPGISCAIVINNVGYHFDIKRSKATFVGKKPSSYQNLGLRLEIFDGTSEYLLEISKTAAFEQYYRSSAPLIATSIFVTIIVAISAIFVSFDYFVNKHIMKKSIILKTKQLFVRYISHEIRTPINTIHIGISLLLHELRSARDRTAEWPEEVRSQLEHWHEVVFAVSESSDTAIQVLNDLLDYEQIQISKLNMDLTAFSPYEVFENVFQSFKYNIEAKKISGHFETDLNEEEISSSSTLRNRKNPGNDASRCAEKPLDRSKLVFNGDRKKIEQVARNILSNAIKFTLPGGEIRMSVSWIPDFSPEIIDDDTAYKSTDGYIQICVKDNGLGLSEQQVSKLFNEGVQFDANRVQDGKGSGLGLWITKGIVIEHRGHVIVESEGLGKGATFVVILPVIYDNGFKLVRIQETIPRDHVSICKGSSIVNVLIVDDSVGTVKIIKKLLTNAGFVCETAIDGLECLDKLQYGDYHKKCHMVLIDNHMPRMDGPTAVAEIRRRGYDLFIVGLTGSVTKAELDEFQRSGCDAVLSKPLQIDQFQYIIDKQDAKNVKSNIE